MKKLEVFFELGENLRVDILEWLHKHTDVDANYEEIRQLAPLELKQSGLGVLFNDKKELQLPIPRYYFAKAKEGYELALNIELNNKQYDALFSFFSDSLSSYIKKGNKILGSVKNVSSSHSRKILDFKSGKIGYCESVWH